MRLINVNSLELEEFMGGNIPAYAILSHTWGSDEVSLQNFKTCIADPISPFRSTGGFQKIKNACNESRRHKMVYLWVDTCCIDKTSSAELTEAINSMFEWYRNANVCLVHLEDFESTQGEGTDLRQLGDCRWFTRGWCLQELLAPDNNLFYDNNWNYFTDKLSIIGALADITGIDRDVLSGQEPIANHPLARRMSWAARRVTTRIEDEAYCLLGLLHVNMPMLYGEGTRAFVRLQEELLRSHDDPSIFVWCDYTDDSKCQSILAPRVHCFANSGDIEYSDETFSSIETLYARTNKGIRVTSPELLLANCSHEEGWEEEEQPYLLVFGQLRRPGNLGISVALNKVGPGTYLKLNELYVLEENNGRLTSRPDVLSQEKHIHIIQDWNGAAARLLWSATRRLRVECRGTLPDLREAPYQDLRPRAAWDSANSRFLASFDRAFVGYIKLYPTQGRDRHDSVVTPLVLMLEARPTMRGAVMGTDLDAWLTHGAQWERFERSEELLQSILARVTSHEDATPIKLKVGDTKVYTVGPNRVSVTMKQEAIILEGLIN